MLMTTGADEWEFAVGLMNQSGVGSDDDGGGSYNQNKLIVAGGSNIFNME